MLGESTTSVLGGGAGGESAVPETTNHRHDELIGDLGDGGAATTAEEENNNNNNNSGEDERGRSGGGGGGDDGDRSFGGNRWPRQETLALLKIRSEMDVAFRDASVKGPLWEQVSRKLGELGYHRSAKKCKEKFENVYKYHKRTKDVRSGKPDSKTYKFFEQLQALENHPPLNFHSHLSKPSPPPPPGMAAPPPTTVISHIPPTVPSTTAVPTVVPHLMNISFTQPNPTIHLHSPPPPAPLPMNNPASLTAAAIAAAPFASATVGVGFQTIEADLISNSTSDDVDSSTSSDEASRRRRRKRKWKDFFEKLMREVIQKQEEMQKRFLEAIEKREQERVVREEAWRMQEMAKINREREILAQERSMAAAKDAAITSFLQKITDSQHNNNTNPSSQSQPPPPPPPSQQQQQPILTSNPTVVQPSPPPPQATTLQIVVPNSTPQKLVNNNELLQMEIMKSDHNGGESYSISPAASSSRWPKVEVQALIKLRTNLDSKYQENGPKGPLWEEISSAMKKIGYNRSSKRCKEKWENINKYFKKVKESKKSRPEDSKTCPYFHQLDALYRVKHNNNNKLDNVMIGSPLPILQHQQQPLMVRPEQQWPPQQEIARLDSGNEDMESEPMDRDDKDDDDDDDEDEEDESGGNYEIVASKPASVSAAE